MKRHLTTLALMFLLFLSVIASPPLAEALVTTATPWMGSYPVGQQVSLSCSGGCDGTYYCLGEGCTSYIAYTGPITLTESTVLRFYSVSIFAPENVHNYRYILDPTLAYRFEQLWPKPEQPQYFNRPQGVAADSSGNVYVADTTNNRIQKFNSAGAFITAWGSFGADTGQFASPVGVAVDTSGNVYVADRDIHRIQKFSSEGVFITTWGTQGSADGQFNYPNAVALDSSNNLYVADTNNHRIQKFTSAGVFVAKWGSQGSGNGQFNAPGAVAVDSSNAIYVADSYNHRVQKFNSSGTYQSQWGNNGSGDGQFKYPQGITIDNTNTVYVSDRDNNRIQKFSSSGGFITQWGSYGFTDGTFIQPLGVASDKNGNIYVADSGNSRIQKFYNGSFSASWGSLGSADGQLYNPLGVTRDSSNNLYVVDNVNRRIQKFTSSGTFVSKWGGSGSGDGQFVNPAGIATDSSGNFYVTDQYLNRIQKFSSDGVYAAQWGTSGSGNGQFNKPYGVATDSNGNLYVTDSYNHRIQKISSDGSFLKAWGAQGSGQGQFSYPKGIAVSGSNIYVVDAGNSRVQKFDQNGGYVAACGYPVVPINAPSDIAVDAAGNIYVSCSGPDSIVKLNSSGELLTKWGKQGSGNGAFVNPGGIVVATDGNVFVADQSNNRIQKFSPLALPGAPTIGTAVAGDARATVSFTPPASTGGNAIITYTVTSSPGNKTGSGTASPVVVSGLTNGTAYTFTVTATNGVGVGPSSGVSNSVTPMPFQQLAVYVTPNTGTVTSNPAGIACNADLCSAIFNYGTSVTLTVTPSTGMYLISWTGDCNGTGPCTVVMTDSKYVAPSIIPLDYSRIDGNSYGTLNLAYAAATNQKVIQVRDLTFTEDLTLAKNIVVTLEGGYATGFYDRSGYTTLDGILTVAQGSLMADMLIIK